MSPSSRLGIALAAALCAPAGATFASNIGVATAVLPAARGTPPAESARILHVGQDLMANERVETDADGKAHLIFLDGSALTVGPNSDLVLDEYVYDPDQRLGRVAISLSRGVLRFVGGGISKKTPVEVRAGTATMGIRGGIAIVEVGEQISATFLFGTEMTLTGGGVTQRVDRPGFQIVTNLAGVPQNPIPVEPERLTATLVTLETARASTALGAPELSDDDVADTQIELLNSTGALGEIEPAAGGAPSAPSLPQPVVVNDMTQLSAQFAAQPPDDDPSEETPPEETPPGQGQSGEEPPAGTTLAGVFTGRAVQAGAADGGLTLLGGQFVNGVFMAETSDARTLSLVETGGAGQVLSNAQPFGPGMLTGTYLALSPQYLLFNLIDELGERIFAFAGQATAPEALPQTGVTAYPLFADFVSGQALPFIEDVGHAGGPNGPAASAGPGRVYVAWNEAVPAGRRAFGGGAVAIFGAGSDQQAASAVIFGDVVNDAQGRPHVQARLVGQRAGGPLAPAFYSGGVSSSDAGDGADLFGPGANFVLEAAAVDMADEVLSRGVVRTEVGGGAAATFHAQHATGASVTQSGARTSRTLTGFAGGLERQFELRPGGPAQTGTAILSTLSNPASGITIQTRADLNNLSASFDFRSSSSLGENLAIGFGGAGRSAFIDDGTFFAGSNSIMRSTGSNPPAEFAGEYALITASELQHDGLLPAGVSFCTCAHLVWGFFGGERNIPAAGGFERWRSLELATWIAGEPSTAGQLTGAFAAGTQSATYQGHVIGSVARAATGATYVAVGGLNMQVGFSPGQYSIDALTIGGFDGLNLSGAAVAGLTAGSYAVQLAPTPGAPQSVAGVAGALGGAFYGPGTPPENAGGGFTLQGPGGYRAAGTFAAAR